MTTYSNFSEGYSKTAMMMDSLFAAALPTDLHASLHLNQVPVIISDFARQQKEKFEETGKELNRVGQLIAEFEKDMERVSSLTKDYDSFRRLSFQNSGEISSEIYAEWGRGCLDDIRKIFLKWKNKRN